MYHTERALFRAQDKFTFSLNKRFALNGGLIGLLEWILFKDHSQRYRKLFVFSRMGALAVT